MEAQVLSLQGEVVLDLEKDPILQKIPSYLQDHRPISKDRNSKN